MNILKTLSHQQWGAEEEALLRIYRGLIRSKLDYGSTIYSTASKTNLKSLEVIHNTSLRICLGAFRSSPMQSLYCEANDLPLSFRREQLLLSYSSSVAATPDNPVQNIFNSLQNLPHPPNCLPSIAQKLKPLLEGYILNDTDPYPISPLPPWTKTYPSIDTTLSTSNKHDTPKALLRQQFNELISRKQTENIIFTDASKNDRFVSCAVTTSTTTLVKCLLPSHCSTHTGELYGIFKALKTITGRDKKVIICTDSLASIDSIRNMYTQNPLVGKIHDAHQELAGKNNAVTIIWVPSHIGIVGNEKADQAAKEVLNENLPLENVQLPLDLKFSFKQCISLRWQNVWSNSNTKLLEVHPSVTTGKLPTMSRRNKIIIRRLRIGHTRITHGHLMEGGNETLCEICYRHLTVRHIVVECPQYAAARLRCGLKGNLKEDLSCGNLINVINFLKEINLYNSI